MKRKIIAIFTAALLPTLTMADTLPPEFSGKWVSVKVSNARLKAKVIKDLCTDADDFGYLYYSKKKFEIFSINFTRSGFRFTSYPYDQMELDILEYGKLKLQQKNSNYISGTAVSEVKEEHCLVLPEDGGCEPPKTEKLNMQIKNGVLFWNQLKNAHFQRCE